MINLDHWDTWVLSGCLGGAPYRIFSNESFLDKQSLIRQSAITNVFNVIVAQILYNRLTQLEESRLIIRQKEHLKNSINSKDTPCYGDRFQLFIINHMHKIACSIALISLQIIFHNVFSVKVSKKLMVFTTVWNSVLSTQLVYQKDMKIWLFDYVASLIIHISRVMLNVSLSYQNWVRSVFFIDQIQDDMQLTLDAIRSSSH